MRVRTHLLVSASFAFFECEGQDRDAAAALFEQVFGWARARGLDRLIGPKGLSPFDGYGLLADAFGRGQLMTMTSYNPSSYPDLLERLGFEKEVDFVSHELTRDTFVMPAGVRRAANHAAGRLQIVRYPSRRPLVAAARRIGKTYNRVREQLGVLPAERSRDRSGGGPDATDCRSPADDLHRRRRGSRRLRAGIRRRVAGAAAHARPRHALGRARIARRAAPGYRVALNGAGILPEYQGSGGNALLQIERAVRAASFQHAELPQVAETAGRMRRDLARQGAVPIKTHRVYRRSL